MLSRTDRRLVVGLALAVLAIIVAAALTGVQTPRDTAAGLTAAPAELTVPPLGAEQLGQWCVDRKARGTAGLSLRAKAWLTDCIVLFGSGLTPTTPSPSPTQPQVTPSTSASAVPTPPPSPSNSPTAAPTPTPNPTPTGLAGCLGQLAACGYPNADNTGPTTAPVITLQGNQTFGIAGQVVEGVRIDGCVGVTAPDVVLRNVIVNCTGYIGVLSSSTGLQIVDSTVTCGGTPGSHGVTRTNVSLLRVEIYGCENGLSIGPNVSVVDSWIHDLYDGGDAHTDGAQFDQDAANIAFVHNTIDARGSTTSALIMWDEGDPQNHDVTITGNLLAGGSYTLYCGRSGAAVEVRIVGNRFGPYTYGYANACDSGGEVWSGNVRDIDDAALAAA